MKEYKFKVNGNDYNVAVNDIEGGVAKVTVNGAEYSVEVGEQKAAAPKFVAPVRAQRSAAPAAAAPVAAAPAAAAGAGTQVKSPLPGTVLEIKAAVGTKVSEGQTVIVLEAMKMENNIDAPKSGVITGFAKSKGDAVLEGDLLFTIE